MREPPVDSGFSTPPDPGEIDHFVVLHNVTWDQYEAIVAIRGDSGGLRMTYVEGELEIMSPSRHHERIKKAIARLLEAFAEEAGLDLEAFGSWTIKEPSRERGAEPDECYVLGDAEGATVPDLAIEVVWTAGMLDKLDVYRQLGVREVWVWEKGRIQIHVLRDDTYETRERSALIPSLDIELLASFATRKKQTLAVQEFRAAIRGDLTKA